jgi:hypothetical protein
MEAMLTGKLQTVFGWVLRTGLDANPRSLRNFPVQGGGAEMLRLACCLATEQGLSVCAPVHDALLVEGPADGIDGVVAATQEAMRKASEVVLDGFSLRTDAKVVTYPDRYVDERGVRMWQLVTRLLNERPTAHQCAGDLRTGAPLPAHQCAPALSPLSPCIGVE